MAMGQPMNRMPRTAMRRDERGLTLVELLIALGLLAVFMTVLASLFTAALDVQNQSHTVSAQLQEGRYVDAKLLYDIGQADSIVTPPHPGDSGSSLQLIIGGTTYTYRLDGATLVRSDGTATQAQALTGSSVTVTDLSFTNVGSSEHPTIRFVYTVRTDSTLPGSQSAHTFSDTAGTR